MPNHHSGCRQQPDDQEIVITPATFHDVAKHQHHPPPIWTISDIKKGRPEGRPFLPIKQNSV
ncbi:MAG: hypothetical protein ACWA7E_23120, partial [Pseudomonas asiatica]